MKTLFVAVLIFCFFISNTFCQINSILAGDTSSNLFTIHDIDSAIYSYESRESNSLDIDVNNDSIRDLTIFGYSNKILPWLSVEGGVSIKLKPGICLAIDTTNYWDGPKVFEFGEKIGNNCMWSCKSDSAFSLVYAIMLYTSPFEAIGENRGKWLNKTEKYMAFKTLSGSDTLYGWFKLTGLNQTSLGIFIHQFAIQKKSTLTIQENLLSLINIYPNPCNDYLNFYLPEINKQYSVVIYSLNGLEIMRIKLNSTKTQLNISSLKPGAYFVKLIDCLSNKTEFRKVILKN